MKATISWTFILFITLILTFEAAAQGWTSRAHADGDLQRLLPLANSVIVSGKKVTMKNTTTYHPYHNETDFSQTAQSISTAFNLPAPNLIQKQDLLLYKFTLIHTDTIQATLLLIGFSDGSTQLSLTAESVQASGIPQLQHLQQQWTTQLRALGLQSSWNVMIQGNVADDANTYTSPGQLGLPPALQLGLTNNLQVRELNRYQDANSLSISYHSSRIDPSAEDAILKMNLQVAVHRDSITGQQRVTIATPAISIAY